MTKHRANNRNTPSERLIAWMKEQIEPGHPRGYSSEFLSRKIGVSRGYIDQIRQGKKPLTDAIAKCVAEIDAAKKPNPEDHLRVDYLMARDDFRTVGEYRNHLATTDLIKTAWGKAQNEFHAFEHMLLMAGYNLGYMKLPDSGEVIYTITTEGGSVPDALLNPEEMTELREELVGYTAYRVQRLLTNRKEVMNDGIHAEADD